MVVKDKNKGFTLTELIWTMVVVGILIAIAVPVYYTILKKARTVEATVALDRVRKHEYGYQAETGRFSSDLNAIGFLYNLKSYTITIVVGDPNPQGGFIATAQGNIDADADLDVWTINQDGNLIHVSAD